MAKTKWFIIWALMYALSIFWVVLLLNKINISNYLISLVIAGVIISLFSIVYKLFLHQHNAHINWYLAYSIALNTFNFWLFNLFTNIFNMGPILNLIMGGIIFEGVWQISHRVPKTSVNKVVFPVALIIILIVTNVYILDGNNSQINVPFQSGSSISFFDKLNSLISKENVTTQSSPSIGFFDKLNSLFSKTNDARCPQINVPITQTKGLLPFMNVKEYDGWKIASYDSNTQLLGFNFGRIVCHFGNKQGQNPDYLYCGDQSSQTTMAYMQKTFMNEDGTIGKTIKQSFVNIYEMGINENSEFECEGGFSPWRTIQVHAEGYQHPEGEDLIDEREKCNEYRTLKSVCDNYEGINVIITKMATDEEISFQCGKEEIPTILCDPKENQPFAFLVAYFWADRPNEYLGLEILACDYTLQKTICGENPDKIAEKEFDQTIRELNELFS